MDFQQLLSFFLGLLVVVSAQWSSVKSKWDDGSFSSTSGNAAGYWPVRNYGMAIASYLPASNMQMVFVPFSGMAGLRNGPGIFQRSTFHKWDDGSMSTHSSGHIAQAVPAIGPGSSAKQGGD